jgi:hypothetical protein
MIALSRIELCIVGFDDNHNTDPDAKPPTMWCVSSDSIRSVCTDRFGFEGRLSVAGFHNDPNPTL